MGKTGRSVGQQDVENKATCERYGMPVYSMYCDDNRSASKYARADRDDWQRLMADITAGHVKVLVVWEPSRATRDRLVWAAVGATCQEREVYICASGTAYDPNDPDDMFQLDLYFAMATRESGITQKRVMRDVEARATAGQPHGRLPYGYRREYEIRRDGTRVLLRQVPDETTSAIVREIFRRFADGEWVGRIATDLTRREIPTPRTAAVWKGTTLRRILVSQTYLGIRTFNGEIMTERTWDAIIDDDLWWRVQARLSSAPRAGRSDNTATKLLSHIPICGVCGASLTANSTNNRKPAYYCRDRYCVGRARAPFDAFIGDYMVALLEDDTRLTADADDPRYGELTEHLAGLQGRLDAFTDSAADGEISRARLARIEARLAPQIVETRRQLKSLRSRIALPDLDLPWREAWDTPPENGGLPFAEKRRLIRESIRIVVHPVGHGHSPGFQVDSIEVTPLWQVDES